MHDIAKYVLTFKCERVMNKHTPKRIKLFFCRGQTLEQIEKFDDPRSSDDEDEVKKFGGLDGEFLNNFILI